MIINIESLYNKKDNRLEPKLIGWLQENIGQFYATDIYSHDMTTRRIGAGWEIVYRSEEVPLEGRIITYFELDIADEEKALMFVLRWL